MRSDKPIHLVPDRCSDPEVEHLPVNPRRNRGPFAIGSLIGEFRGCKGCTAGPTLPVRKQGSAGSPGWHRAPEVARLQALEQ